MTAGNNFWKNTDIKDMSVVIDGVVYNENWAQVTGYEGLYSVSDFGRMKIMGRRYFYSNLGWITTEDRIMKQKVTKSGYLEVAFTKNKKPKYHLSHRVVAKAFEKNPSKKKTVNHKDGDRKNNFVKNLEWNTYSENMKHSFDKLGRVPTFQIYHDNNHPQAKRVRCSTFDMNFGTLKEACDKLNVNRRSVSRVLKNELPHTKGLVFMYI